MDEKLRWIKQGWEHTNSIRVLGIPVTGVVHVALERSVSVQELGVGISLVVLLHPCSESRAVLILCVCGDHYQANEQ